ncbi:glycosyltransferase family 4 protein [Winkia sp. UMB10116]|uniref:glycosyltransferase family 4 protein n=1 Tax=Winkia sp. UMB10116 TaxID=3046355 RepID=UPI002553FCA6|nr:glycosyltransferase family 4 protein [Winkia sp. UMB10116]MDK6239926.1 glycosyltransferase family 4 protein [Winkia sp. UMB10116]
MQILVLSQLWDPEEGISQRRANKLTQTLLEAGHDVTVVASPPHYPGGKLLSSAPVHQPHAFEQVSAHYRIYRSAFREHDFSLPSRIADQAVFLASALKIALGLCRKHHYDLLISTAPPIPNLFVQRLLADLFKIPTLIDLRDAWPDLLDYLGEGNTPTTVAAKLRAKVMTALGEITKVAMGWCIKGAGAITVTSAEYGNQLASRTKAKVLVVYNTLDLPTQVLQHTNLPHDELHVLYAGNIGRAQGLGTALDALRVLQHQGEHVRLRLIGGGAHLPTLRRRAKQANLPVEFVRRISREELGEHFEWAHTALVTLRDWKPLRTTIPSKLFDGLHRGIHLTVSADGEPAAIVTAASAGAAAPANDPQALAALWRDLLHHPHRLQVDGAGRKWIAEHASPAAQARSYLRAVDRAVNNNTYLLKRWRKRK